MNSSIEVLHSLGQSLWYDNIERRLLENGSLAKLIDLGEILGVTSNPSIFEKAIAQSKDYDEDLKAMGAEGLDSTQIFERLAIVDIRAAADLFRDVYEATAAEDGYVSLEVNPALAYDTEQTIAEAKRLWDEVNRPNLMVKIPATQAGLPAITQSIVAGVNVNVTLIFSLKRYAEVISAYLYGLELRRQMSLPIDRLASVASFFVSRVDSKIDKILEEVIHQEGPNAGLAAGMLGKAAVANAKLAYEHFLNVFEGQEFKDLKDNGARVQRPLWASTSTKNPKYADVKYVEELIGPQTVNTVPQVTLDAFRDHGVAKETLTENLQEARDTFQALEDVGISMEQVTHELEEEGVKAFADSYDSLIESIEKRKMQVDSHSHPASAQ